MRTCPTQSYDLRIYGQQRDEQWGCSFDTIPMRLRRSMQPSNGVRPMRTRDKLREKRKHTDLPVLGEETSIHVDWVNPAAEYARAVHIALHRGRFDEARSLITRAQEAYNETCAPRPLTFSDSVYQLELFNVPHRILNTVYERGRCRTIGELYMVGPTRIVMLPEMGVSSINKLKQALKDAGFNDWK